MRILTFGIFPLLLISMIIIPHSTSAAEGDTLAEAFNVGTGTYTGQFTSGFQNFYYNLSASPFQTYNITLSHMNLSDAPFRIYLVNGVQIKANNSIYSPKTFLVSGYSHYSIRFYTSDFTLLPDTYTLSISIAETEDGKSLNNAYTVSEGIFTGNLTSYTDFDWYNFTAQDDQIYNITLSHSAETYYTMSVYDSEINLLGSNIDVDSSKYLLLSGESKYLIAVRASEFSTTPHEYNLIIANVISGTTTETSTVTTTETHLNEQVSIQTSFVTTVLVSFNTQAFILAISLTFLIVNRRRK